jgi:YVTN family beta-propeller protein
MRNRNHKLAGCIAGGMGVLMSLGFAVGLVACSDDPGTTPPTQDAGDGGGGDGGPVTVSDAPSRGSSIALTQDDTVAVAVNRDVGSVSVFGVVPDPIAITKKGDVDLGAGSEPWQVVVTPDGASALVVLRQAQQVVKIDDLKGTPKKGAVVKVGSEPTGIALSPTGRKAYVANWVDGTLAVIDTQTMTVTKTVDLNAALVGTGLLGTVAARPALAHPRSVAVTNNGDANDDDETILVTEYFAQRVEAEQANGSNADTSKNGVVYKIGAGDLAVSTIKLKSLADIGFKDATGGTAGCFPNQLQSITIQGKQAFVTSVCASPKGPLQPVSRNACTTDADCTAAPNVDSFCVNPTAQANAGTCNDVANIKTVTSPVVSVIDLTTGTETDGTANLNARFRDEYVKGKVADDASRRYPLLAMDVDFVKGGTIAYVAANGADAVFRVKYDASGAITEVGAPSNMFINLNPTGIAPEKAGQLPTGIAVSRTGKGFALVANDATRNVLALDFNTQSIRGGAAAPVVAQGAALPAGGSDAEKVLHGKRFFATGMGRWSLKGQGWGACQNCHMDGLTDNVTWYFARGPRQSTSLDGSWSKKDATDQRIFNWSGIFDELSDFEGNTRGVSGGIGAIVKAKSTPPALGDRIDLANVTSTIAGETGSHDGLNGSSAKVADPANPLSISTPGQLPDWSEMTKFLQGVRSPRGASNLDAGKVTAGRALFESKNCAGCHGGDKWTISKVFYAPSKTVTDALLAKAWTAPGGFPVGLLPAASGTMRAQVGGAGNDQLLCMMRNVGTFGVAETGVGIAEVRANMVAVAQGNDVGAKGYNPPSLKNLVTGAPYLHGGNARTLEALLDETFKAHHQAFATNFLDPSTQSTPTEREQLVSFLLSIDDATTTVAAPASAGATGGNFCAP